jgi:hypothetical protein
MGRRGRRQNTVRSIVALGPFCSGLHKRCFWSVEHGDWRVGGRRRSRRRGEVIVR